MVRIAVRIATTTNTAYGAPPTSRCSPSIGIFLLSKPVEVRATGERQRAPHRPFAQARPIA